MARDRSSAQRALVSARLRDKPRESGPSGTIDRMSPSKAEVLAMLDAYARMPKATGTVGLPPAYLRAVDRWQELTENAAGADKSWVDRSRRRFGAHFAKARVAT
jgi:hypothetical protein